LPRAASVVVGVGHPAKFACLGNWSNRSEPSSLGLMSAPLSFQSLVVVVTQPLSNKPEALADVRGADARSAQISRPKGVARCFHVRLYSVEPSEAVLARNLLSKHNWRTALGDEAIELGPEVTLVGKSCSLSGGAEGLAGAGAGPDGPLVGPSSETEGMGPDADTGEEVALGVAVEVRSSHVPNGSFIDISVSDQFIGDQVAQPLRGVGVYLVIVRNHSSTSSFV
jgi:hypothetical protein